MRAPAARPTRLLVLCALALLAALSSSPSPASATGSGAAVEYDVRVVAPEHHWMEVEVTFRDVPEGPLQLRMSRSSPGRYALHEFAKNVFQLQAWDAAGEPLAVERPDPYGWIVPEHGTEVVVAYRIFGDRADGTYLQVDTSHAHMNAPATFLWARGLTDRPVQVRLHAPSGADWVAATQLFPSADSSTFTAPNTRYLMDSPIEFGATRLYEFEVSDGGGPQTIRLALHHAGTEQQAREFLDGVRSIVEEARGVYGEYPRFDGGTYTFIADYLPWADGDGMEHRNSTILTSSASLAAASRGLLGTVSHEFFHAWNVERIRPASLEPFDFERANMSSELWLAEGFTSYYGDLILHRAGLVSLGELLGRLGSYVNQAINSPGARFRSAVQMSRLAPFVDAARPVDRTYWDNTFLSYYTYGAAIALGLDLTIRAHSDGALSLDDFMRAMWREHGSPGSSEPPDVSRPYDVAAARSVLGEVLGDPEAAREFFDRHIEGTETIDYAHLLERAGLVLQPTGAGSPWLGAALQPGRDGLRIAEPTETASPAYLAGLDRDDTVLSLGGRPVRSAADVSAVLGAHAPGDEVAVRYRRRDGTEGEGSLTLQESPSLRIAPAEAAGSSVTDAQRSFRSAWLASRARH